jgi:hypothetical protein
VASWYQGSTVVWTWAAARVGGSQNPSTIPPPTTLVVVMNSRRSICENLPVRSVKTDFEGVKVGDLGLTK